MTKPRLIIPNPQKPNLDALSIIGMIPLGNRALSIAAIGLVSISDDNDYPITVTFVTGHTEKLTAEEWKMVEEHLRQVQYAMARQQGIKLAH